MVGFHARKVSSFPAPGKSGGVVVVVHIPWLSSTLNPKLQKAFKLLP